MVMMMMMSHVILRVSIINLTEKGTRDKLVTRIYMYFGIAIPYSYIKTEWYTR